jgi:hypothetical protein
MANVEERVVGMSFDNSKLMSGLKPAIDGLDKLKESLKLDGATQGIQELDEAGKRFSLAPIGAAAEGISGKFVALATIGITALSNIVNKAVDAGQRIMSALTIDPIKAGFDEYELKMGSIQTILANTARYNTGLPEVTASLDELNKYADKTIYNFGAMTKNIGLFTNAGIGIQDATSMIKGFSNAAAASGTSAEGASGAAYQLSQALSTGKITLMDWRSLTNVGMGNKNMQEGIIQIAQAMGTLDEAGVSADEVTANFNGTLEKGWLKADVMSTYLKIMAGDMDAASLSAMGLSDETIAGFTAQQKTAEEAATKVRTFSQLFDTMKEAVGSGWSETFDIILGDFESATELFTGVNDSLSPIIAAASDARNKILQDWSDAGGRADAINAVSIAFGTLMKIINVVKGAAEDIFPPLTGQNLADITRGVLNLVKALVPSQDSIENIRSAARGFFAVLDIGWMVIKRVADVIGNVLPFAFKGAGGGILDAAGNFGDFLVKIHDMIRDGSQLNTFFNGLSNVLIHIVGYIRNVVSFLGLLGGAILDIAKNGAEGGIERLQDRFASFGNFFGGIMVIVTAFGKAVHAVADFFEPFVARIGQLTQGLGAALSDAFSTGNFDTVLDMVNTGLLAGIGALVWKFIGTIKGMFAQAKPEGGLVDSIKGVFGQLTDTLGALQAQIKAKTLMTIAAAVGILTLSVIALSMIDTGKLFIALGAITTMFVQLGTAMSVFEKMFSIVDATKLTILGAALIAMGTAMLIFSGAVAILGSMSWESLAKGLVGLAAALGIVSVAMLILSKTGPGAILGSAALTIAAVGITLIAGALQLMALLSWDDIGRAMTVLGGSMAILAAGLYLMEGALPGAAALTIASVGIAVIAGALLLFAKLSWDDIGRGMATLGSTLAILAVGLTLMILALPGAAALVVAAGGLAVMAGVLALFSLLSWEDIGQAMTTLGGTLGILAVGLTLMIAALPGAAALVVAAAALAILAPVLLALGSLSWDQIGTGLAVLALSLGLIAVAGYALIPAIPGLLGLGAAVALLGVGVLAAGLGIAALGVGLTSLSVGVGAAITVITAAVSSVAALIPYVLQQVGLGIIEIINIIGQNGPAILGAITAVLTALIQAIVTIIPAVVDAIVLLVTKLVEALVVLIPLLVDGGMRLIIGILDGIGRNIGKVIEKGTDIIVNLLAGIGAAIPRLLQAGAQLIIDFVNGIADTIRAKSAAMRQAGANVASAIIEGMTGGITNGIATVANAARKVAESALNAAKGFLGIHSPSKEFYKIGGFSTEGMANGLLETSKVSERAAAQVGSNTLQSMKEAMARAGDYLAMGGMDSSPTIRPVLDLSGVKKDAGLISGIVNGQSLSVDGATARANAISAKYGEYQQAMADSSGPTTEVNLTQNLYSPKALPDAEIYRQTNNQMSILKGELEKRDA